MPLRTLLHALHLETFAPAAMFACAGLLLSACLRPPASKAGAAGGEGNDGQTNTGAATAIEQSGPRAFSHTSLELMAKLRLGWNFGNALDAPDGETSWGSPRGTPELFQAVAKAGFRLVRIPVTWSRYTAPGPSYTIDPSWMARVDEVVSYAHAAGLYAVINLHHDGADGYEGVEWLTLNDKNGQTTEENNALVRERFLAVWEQIAKHFKGYGEELLFESMNEIHDGYGEPDPRHFTFINDLNQRFVDLVRASGGNNAERHLIVPGYNTNVDHTLKGFKLPKDPTPNRLSLSVHYYDPYLFALMAEKHTWGKGAPDAENWGQEEAVVAQFDKLKSAFISQGVPVFLGEYGAVHQDGYEQYRRYWLEYVTKAAVDRGMLPVYWDNSAKGSGQDKFAILDRHSYEAVHPEMLEALVRAATSTYSLSDVKKPAP